MESNYLGYGGEGARGRRLATAGGAGVTYRTMEFLNFGLILWAGWLLWRRPERERLAFRLLVVSSALMALLFLLGTHGSFVPGVNL
jgi:heme A synthase